MRTQSSTEENQSLAVTPPIQPRMPWRVTAVEALPGYRLHVRFVDHTEGIVSLAELVRSSQAGVFAVLSDPALFAQVYVECGAVTWPGELDLAPDAMYAGIKESGQWMPRPGAS